MLVPHETRLEDVICVMFIVERGGGAEYLLVDQKHGGRRFQFLPRAPERGLESTEGDG